MNVLKSILYSLSTRGFSYASTFPAMPIATPDVGVIKVKGMTKLTVRFHCSFFINFVRDSLKMARVYAKNIATQVVKFKSFWYKSNRCFVGVYMSQNIFMLALNATKIKFPIAVPIFSCLPFPTSIRQVWLNLFPKSFRSCFIHISILPRIWKVNNGY